MILTSNEVYDQHTQTFYDLLLDCLVHWTNVSARKNFEQVRLLVTKSPCNLRVDPTCWCFHSRYDEPIIFLAICRLILDHDCAIEENPTCIKPTRYIDLHLPHGDGCGLELGLVAKIPKLDLFPAFLQRSL